LESNKLIDHVAAPAKLRFLIDASPNVSDRRLQASLYAEVIKLLVRTMQAGCS
jgi:hypothetical protein